jgi:hypothetical protein
MRGRTLLFGLASALLLYACMGMLTRLALAQAPALYATWQVVDPVARPPTVGDVITLQLFVTGTSAVSFEAPELPAQWGAFEVRAQQPLDEKARGDAAHAVFQVQAVLWAPGEYETPPMNVRYREAGGAVDELFVEPITLSVASVLPATEDPSADLSKRDLKPQAELKRPPVWPWYLAALAGVAALACAVRWLWRRRRVRRGASMPVPAVVDLRPPHQIAYDELARIASLRLPEQGEFKRHYTLLTDCLRAYIEGRYEVPAMDRTSYELLRDLGRMASSSDGLAILGALLQEADLAKFARAEPSVADAHEALARARAYVELSRLITPALGAAPEGSAGSTLRENR